MKSNGFSEAPARRAPDVFNHLIERLCPAYRNRITAELRPEEKDGFQLADAPGGRIRISGNTPVSLAAGLNYYLRERAGVHLSWCGDRLALPPEPPPVSTEVRREFPLPLRPCLNYCTFGYSMVWWEWPRWEREIDFMALNGINMPLAVTGIEAIYLRTLLHFGLSREEILAFLSGPAFLPWQYMHNLDSHAGPLPSPWITSHLALGRRILERERAWGMKPILPGFSGHVPEAFARLYPRCRFIRSEGWCGFAPVVTIDPADPMFAEVNAVFLRELTGTFGTDHYYSIDLFHEQRLDRCSPDHLAACGRSVSAALLAADPEAVWVMQAWSERPEIIRNIPAGRLLLLDIGKERLKATGGLDGRPVVWGTIHSFGGQTEIGGDLAAIPREIAEQRRRFPNLAGAGAFPESIGNNPVLFELVFDSALCGGELDDARVVDQNVNDSDFLLNALDQGLHSGFVRHVADIAMRVNALFFVSGQPLVDQLLTDIVKNNRRACLGVSRCNVKADAVGSARHKCDFSLEGETVQNIHAKQPSFFYFNSVVGISSISSNAWFSPPIAQMKV